MNLHIMIGIPGAGKDTFLRNKSGYILSSDAIREELGDINDQSQNQKVFQILHNRLKQALNQNVEEIWINATNVTIKDRRQYIELGKKYKYNIIAELLAVDIDTAIRRDKHRTKCVGKEVIEKFIARFQIPFYEEGFDVINIHKDNHKPYINIIQIKQIMKQIEQTGIWHTENLLKHSLMVYEKTNSIWGFLHDYGKIYTQTKDTNGYYHFYNHNNVGAYRLLTEYRWDMTNIELLDGLFLVNYHDLIYKTNKYNKLFGIEKTTMLQQFRLIDEQSAIPMKIKE